MNLMRFEPFKDVERLFETFSGLNPKIGWDLAVDLYEKDGNVIAEMNLPGIDPAHLEITVEDNHLRIAGTRQEEKETKEKTFYAKEIHRGSFERMIRLPFSVKDKEAQAEYKNGVLRITLPKDSGSKVSIKVK